MGKKQNQKERQIGKKQPEKKYLIDPRYKNTFWTIVFLVVLLIFFIVNNTREVPENGPYPPNYDQGNSQNQNKDIPEEVKLDPGK